ncbi:cell division protein FtsZ [Haematospirillum sp. H1815]|uniref:cell division protein FtsZ n=1 Tax=Haematospirillum sp. H1815 TaxID=2723108 RepID=UPI0014387326|nr:cell division protein FtsZ [Haematospirillum sp. H1815]NKD76724.1 cell division protein FtsZ [Haematospirillum sp. H1815]
MINLTVPQQGEPLLKPHITVVGVGGAGGNAVNNMIADNLQGVDFVVSNTDAQALTMARTNRRIQLGETTTQGLGAGARPEVGRAAAEETVEQIAAEIQGSNMVFITAGMGGGTGTGAAPVIARVAREMGILTVGVVTKPFQFEGANRMRLAESGIEDLSQYVDTLIIIPNQNLFRVANEKTTFADAFKMADNVLHQGVRSITDLMILPGLINLDFADVRTVMSDMGRAMMGTGEATGERRALDAAEAAIANPLLEDTCMKGARGVLINITTGMDVTLFEVDEAANRIRDEVEGEAHIIFGSCFDPSMEGTMRVSVVATGINSEAACLPQAAPMRPAVQQQPQPQMVQVVQAPRVPEPAPVHAPPAFAAPAHANPAAVQSPIPVPVQAAQTTAQPSYQAMPAQVSVSATAQMPPRREADTFIPAQSASHDPLAYQMPQQHGYTSGAAAHAQAAAVAPAAAVEPVLYAEERTAPASAPRNNLFARLSRLAHRDEMAPAEAHVEAHPAAAAPVAAQAMPVTRREEDELEIPAFLRRQAN